MRPNPPRMITIIASLVLLAVGLAGSVVAPGTVNDFLASLPLPSDLERLVRTLLVDRQVAYACLLASPLLLVVGSLLPGV